MLYNLPARVMQAMCIALKNDFTSNTPLNILANFALEHISFLMDPNL